MCEAKNDSIKRKVKNAEIHAYDGLKKIKVLCEQTRELTHDFLDYV